MSSNGQTRAEVFLNAQHRKTSIELALKREQLSFDNVKRNRN